MPQQTAETTVDTYKARIAKLQEGMKEFGLRAVVMESGPAMMDLTGVRWGRSERSPYQRIAGILKDRGVALGRVGIEDSVRFFVYDGVRQAGRQAPKLEYVSAQTALKAAGVDLTQPAGRGGRKQ